MKKIIRRRIHKRLVQRMWRKREGSYNVPVDQLAHVCPGYGVTQYWAYLRLQYRSLTQDREWRVGRTPGHILQNVSHQYKQTANLPPPTFSSFSLHFPSLITCGKLLVICLRTPISPRILSHLRPAGLSLCCHSREVTHMTI